jgi:hypothetical protein
MTQVPAVPDDWDPRHRCCLKCGNSEPEVALRAITHSATTQQALACNRHIAEVTAVLDSHASAPRTAPTQSSTPAITPVQSSAPAPQRRPHT